MRSTSASRSSPACCRLSDRRAVIPKNPWIHPHDFTKTPNVIHIEDVDTPAGTFFGCVKHSDNARDAIWYCRGVGIVRTSFGNSVTALSDFSPRYSDVRYRPKPNSGETIEAVRRRLAAAREQNAVKEDAKKRLTEFLRAHKAQERVRERTLKANPFVFQGKRVWLSASFAEMTSETEALFGNGPDTFFVVTGIPKGLFTNPRDYVIVGSVTGKTEVKIPVLGAVSVPRMSFVGSHACEFRDCAELN